MAPNTITISDLASPQLSEDAKAFLEQEADYPYPYSMKGIMDAVSNKIDVPIFEDPVMLDSIERFVQEAGESPALTQAGKAFIMRYMVYAIVQRSRLEALFDRHPEIADVKLEKPLIITGMGRSGTTHLCNILSAADQFNTLSNWEGPQPFPELDIALGKSTAKDTRRDERKIELHNQIKLIPYFPSMLDIPVDGTTEELFLMHLSGCPVMFLNYAITPKWTQWHLKEMDPRPMYEVMKRSLQALQWLRGDNKRWLLKSPLHMSFMPYLKEQFPDMRLVLCHRDPSSSYMSNSTMVTYLMRQTYSKVDIAGATNNALLFMDTMTTNLVRDIDDFDKDKVHNVLFHQYMADVMQTLKDIWECADIPWTPEVEAIFQHYIDTHPRGKVGRLIYDESIFPLSRPELVERFRPYIDKFGIKIETNHL